ncbi:lipopolysaccharide-induced tumor necrosis factor-alpha factor homolog [Diorhabda carinulata]|nr:lipopolysaccharide-induced tumor necrosis factor-alpha factor homolog [Diorhabda carinulata]
MEKSQNPPPYSPPQPGFQPPPPQPGFQPPPQGGYQGPPQSGFRPQQDTQTVIVTHTVAHVPVGPSPTSTTCPSCHAQIVTSVETETTTKTHLFALLLCLFGCWPCCCIPYCMDSCQAKTHYCPNCRAYIGKYEN